MKPRLAGAALAALAALGGCGDWRGDPTAWPPGFRTLGTKDIACSEAAAAAEAAPGGTSAGASRATLTVANGSGVWIALARLTPDGGRVESGLIAPWETVRRATHVGTPWLITESAGRCLYALMPAQGSATVEALPPRR